MLLAHSFGERYDLPIPLLLFVIGGALTVVASFAVVLRRSAGDPVEGPDTVPPAAHRPLLGWFSVAATTALGWAGLTGTQDVSGNLLPISFWLLAWLVVPLTCGVIGDWTRPVNPFGFLSALADSGPARQALLARSAPLAWPARLGWWPATALLLLLVSAELILNASATLPRVIATGLLVYALACLLLGLLFGPAWRERGEVFTVLFATWGRLGRWRFGAPGRTGFAGGLVVPLDPSGGRVAFVLLLLVSVNMDGLLSTPWWASVEAGRDAVEVLRFGTLLLVGALVGAGFAAFAAASARLGRHDVRPLGALAGLLPSLLPIAYGYLVAHNLQYVLVNAQLLPGLLGNPTGEADLGLPAPFDGSSAPDPSFLPSAVYWYAGVAAIVAAHVVAVVLAHRYLHARGADRRSAEASEYPWLAAMVAYTMLSLVLIAQPLVQE